MLATSWCSEVLYVTYKIEDYYNFENNIPVYFDNTSEINLSKNLIQHFKVKHI